MGRWKCSMILASCRRGRGSNDETHTSMPTTSPPSPSRIFPSRALSAPAVRHGRALAMVVAGVGAAALSGLSAAACGLIGARIQGNEVSTIGSLRSIVSAQMVYSSDCGAGAYAPSLEWLGKPNPTRPGSPPYLTADLARPAPFERSGYVIRMRSTASPETAASCNGVPAGQGVLHWAVVAANQRGHRLTPLCRHAGWQRVREPLADRALEQPHTAATCEALPVERHPAGPRSGPPWVDQHQIALDAVGTRPERR